MLPGREGRRPGIADWCPDPTKKQTKLRRRDYRWQHITRSGRRRGFTHQQSFRAFAFPPGLTVPFACHRRYRLRFRTTAPLQRSRHAMVRTGVETNERHRQSAAIVLRIAAALLSRGMLPILPAILGDLP